MKNHTCDPRGRNADGKQTGDFQHCAENRFAACPVAAVHNVIAGSDGTSCQIDQQHIFSIKHRFTAKPKQGKQRLIEQKSYQADDKRNCWTNNRKPLCVLISFHVMSGPYFFSDDNRRCVCKSSEECIYETFQDTESSHGCDRRFRLASDYHIDQHLSDSVEQLVADDGETLDEVNSQKCGFKMKHLSEMKLDGLPALFQEENEE